jgi:hypothetical protein
MIAERTQYKGNPILILKNELNEKYPFSFGVKKAKLILEHIGEIRAFVADNSGDKK